jgi:hypothetical protein
VEVVGDKKSLLPRTRDDSSDEEENPSSRSPEKGALLVSGTCIWPLRVCTDGVHSSSYILKTTT